MNVWAIRLRNVCAMHQGALGPSQVQEGRGSGNASGKPGPGTALLVDLALGDGFQ